MSKKLFPKNFLFGSATSAHQIEGGQDNDWSRWEKTAGNISDGSTSKIAANSWNKWRDDIKLLKNGGQNAYRFSIEWSRIEPREGFFDQKAIEHYREMIDELIKNDITPMVTLFHFTCPLWIEKIGGLANRKCAKYFARFSAKMAEEFGDKVRLWSVLNEPSVYVNNGYFISNWYPGKHNYIVGLKVFFNLIFLHKQAWLSMKKVSPTVKVGIAMNMTAFSPNRNNIFDRILTRISKWITNEFFINQIKNQLDFLGINHYTSHKIQCKKPLMVGYVENGLSQVIIEAKKWNLPIYITENGVPDESDKIRQKFIVDAFEQLSIAINNGADLRGYFYWSLIDNFEWGSGYSMKFGLHTIKRKARKSLEIYRDIICRNNVIK